MMLIGRGDKPRDRCQFADHHTNLSTGNAVKCRPNVYMLYSLFAHAHQIFGSKLLSCCVNI